MPVARRSGGGGPRLKVEYVGLAVMALAVVVFIMMVAVVASPFEPIRNYTIEMESEVCPGQDAESTVMYDLDPAMFDAITEIEVQTSWVAEDVPGIEAGTERLEREVTLKRDQLHPGRTEDTGRAVRIAPSDPGVWRVHVRNVVRGWPRVQEVLTPAEEPTTVLDVGSDNCEDKRI